MIQLIFSFLSLFSLFSCQENDVNSKDIFAQKTSHSDFLNTTSLSENISEGAFIILDEAQNCTKEQLKMFLTRLGFDSKAVITGDITQSDLPGGKPTGLIQAQALFKNIDGIKFIYLTGSDIVRHELVQKIIEAYARASHKK